MSTVKTTNLQAPSAASPAIVLASDGTATAQLSSLNGGALAGARNRIINGDMRIAQRGTSLASLAVTSGSFLVDRWRVSGTGSTAVVTMSQSTDVPNDTFLNSLRLQVTTADAAVASGDTAQLVQPIEGYNVKDLIGQTFAISFWVKSPKTGTHCVSLVNGNQDRSYVLEYSVNSANTWEFKSLVVTGGLITTGVWDWTIGTGIAVRFSLMAGSTYHGTAGSWQAANNLATVNQVNVLDNTSNNFYITGVQLEAGTVATPFERRSYGQELALCQRYFQLAGNGCFGVTADSVTLEYAEKFIAEMRAAPTATWRPGSTSRWRIFGSGDVNNGSSTSLANTSTTTYGLWTQQGGFASLTSGRFCASRNGASDSLFINLSAEL